MESNDFVTVGSALPQCEDDEIISRKPVAVHDQVVRDDQGRIRFHGAFTGGFSAGYFNSVDTKEGWVPKTFKSSRSSRIPNKNAQKPEDFMDDEDFGEYGIAPKKLSTSNKYQGNSKQSWKPSHDSNLLSLFSNSHLQLCIEPAKLTVGQKLLKRLGWKTADVCEEPEDDNIFGCALPPELVAKRTSKKLSTNQADNIHPINFSFQINQFGLGYEGLARQPIKKSSENSSMQSRSRGIKGQGFGVGALEEDDEDIYAGESTANYNTILYLEDEEPTLTPIKTTHDKKDKEAVDGFKRSSEIPVRIETYPVPVIPGYFTPLRSSTKVKLSTCPEEDLNKQKPGNYHQPMTIFKRGEMLGEKPQIGSVFELVSEKDKLRIEGEKRSSVNQSYTSKLVNKEEELIQSSSSKSSSIINNNHEFKVTETKDDETMTEWEKEQKNDNLTKANHPSADVLMGRFVKESGSSAPIVKELNAKENAASKNMFGHLTREIVTWHPAKLLCVRFNIEDPYPESSVVGLPTQKHSKLSIFNVLTKSDLIVSAEQQPRNSEPAPRTIVKSERPPTSKPLAILATVDLRPPAEEKSTLNLIPADIGNFIEDTQRDVEMKTSAADTSEEVTEAPAPSIDIFKAIFEDDDSEEEESEKEELKHTASVDVSEPHLQISHHIEDISEDIKEKDQCTPDSYQIILSDKKKKDKKAKKEKHKKHKHSHKSKKAKSKKERYDESDDDSIKDSRSKLSREERHLLMKRLQSLQATTKARE